MQETAEELRDVMVEAKSYMSGEVGNSGRCLGVLLPGWRCGCACWALGWKTLVPGNEINLPRPFRVFY